MALSLIEQDRHVTVEASPNQGARNRQRPSSALGPAGLSFAVPPGSEHTAGADHLQSKMLELMMKQQEVVAKAMTSLADQHEGGPRKKDEDGVKSMLKVQAEIDQIKFSELHTQLPSTAQDMDVRRVAATGRRILTLDAATKELVFADATVEQLWQAQDSTRRDKILSGKSLSTSSAPDAQITEALRLFVEYLTEFTKHMSDATARAASRSKLSEHHEIAEGWKALAVGFPSAVFLVEATFRHARFYGENPQKVRMAMLNLTAYCLRRKEDLSRIKELMSLGLPAPQEALSWATASAPAAMSSLVASAPASAYVGADSSNPTNSALKRELRRTGEILPCAAQLIGRKHGRDKSTVRCGFCKSLGHEVYECPAAILKHFPAANIVELGWSLDATGCPLRLPGYFVNGDEDGPMAPSIAAAWLDHAWCPLVETSGFGSVWVPDDSQAVVADAAARRAYGKQKWYEWANRSLSS